MKKIISLIFLLLVNFSIAEVFEYDDIIFYPNNSQSINISKLYIDINDINMFQTYIIYKNKTYLFPQLTKNETVDLPVKNLNISVSISAMKVSESEWTIYYTVKNDYNHNIPVNISFPSGYNLNNISIVVPSKSSKTITLLKNSPSDTIYFEDSNISFIIPSKIKIRYSLSIPFSIEKSNKILNNGTVEWNANCSIYNNKNIPLKLNVSVWAVVEDKNMSLGNFSNILLNPNSTFEVSYSIYSDGVPIFYMDFYNWNETYRDIVIKPALKENKSYIIGIARVKGRSFTYYYNTPDTGDTGGTDNTKDIKDETENTEETEKTGEPETTLPESSIKTNSMTDGVGSNGNDGGDSVEEGAPVSEIANAIKEKAKEYLLKPYSKESEIIGIKIKKLDNTKDLATVSIPLSLLSLLFAPLLFLNIYPDVLDGGNINPKLCRILGRKVYVPYGVKLGNILPLNITLVSPNSYLVSEIYESFDIPLSSAKALAIALEYGGRLITHDIDTYKIAVKIGIDSIYVGEK
jgi:hypothetical protein